QGLPEFLVGEALRVLTALLLRPDEIVEHLAPLAFFGIAGRRGLGSTVALSSGWRSLPGRRTRTCRGRRRRLARRLGQALRRRALSARGAVGSVGLLARETERAHLRLVGNVTEHLFQISGAPRHATLRGHCVDAVVEVR